MIRTLDSPPLLPGATDELVGNCPAFYCFNLFQCFIIKETLTEPCLCCIGNGKYLGLTPCCDGGSEREPKVGGNQAEFNDGELLRAFTDLCPPFAHGLALKSQKQSMESSSSSPRQAAIVPWTFVQNTKC